MHKIIIITLFILIIIQAPAFADSKNKSTAPELVLEENENDENYMFPRNTRCFIDDEKNIYALLVDDSVIKKYDKDGKFLFQFGRMGEGPGELWYAFQMEFTKETIRVYQLDRTTIFSKDGKYIDTQKRNTTKVRFRFMDKLIKEGIYLQEDFDHQSKTVKLFIGTSIDDIHQLIEEQETEYTENSWSTPFVFTIDSHKIPIYGHNNKLVLKEYINGTSRILTSYNYTQRKIIYENGKPNSPYFKDYYRIIRGLVVDKRNDIWIYTISNEFTGFLKLSRDGKEIERYALICCDLLPFYFYPYEDYLYYITASDLEGIKVFRIKL
ncbi:MAG: hypothetical protein JW737_06915 [Acidobacteria bacterium]|nr:hypothetical protein [Acidobacteriota bacterium]